MNLSVEKLSAGYEGKEVLHEISFDIDGPGITVVLGKNGSGKTTLFRALTGILKTSPGCILYNGKPIFDAGISIGYYAHTYGVPMGFSVSQIIEFFAGMENVDDERIDEVRRLLDLESIWDSGFTSLSQGQKKKVSLAKCLLRDRDLYIFDEPTSNLDPNISSEIREIMRVYAQKKIVIYSSHNLYEAQELGTDVVMIDTGRIRYSGSISGISIGIHTIGIRGEKITSIYPDAKLDGKYYTFTVKDQNEVDQIVKKLVESGARIYEVKELGNPLEELYGGQN
jgi:ABC-2 type transport system ATP-binding protein